MAPKNSKICQPIETTNLEYLFFNFYIVNWEKLEKNIGKFHQSLQTTKLKISLNSQNHKIS